MNGRHVQSSCYRYMAQLQLQLLLRLEHFSRCQFNSRKTRTRKFNYPEYPFNHCLLGLKKLQDVIQLPPPQQPIAVLPIGDGPDYRPLWKDVKEYGENRFVVDCSLDKVIDFLGQARDFELIGEDQHFLLTNFDTHTLPPSQFKQFPSNITSVKISAPEHLLRETTYDWMDYELKRGVKYEIDERRVKVRLHSI